MLLLTSIIARKVYDHLDIDVLLYYFLARYLGYWSFRRKQWPSGENCSPCSCQTSSVDPVEFLGDLATDPKIRRIVDLEVQPEHERIIVPDDMYILTLNRIIVRNCITHVFQQSGCTLPKKIYMPVYRPIRNERPVIPSVHTLLPGGVPTFTWRMTNSYDLERRFFCIVTFY